MTPLRRMILQFSHSFLTDARTFINSILFTVQNDSTFGKVEWRHFQRHFLSGCKLGRTRLFPSNEAQHPMAIWQLDLTVFPARRRLDYRAFNFDNVPGHVKISGSDSVTR